MQPLASELFRRQKAEAEAHERIARAIHHTRKAEMQRNQELELGEEDGTEAERD